MKLLMTIAGIAATILTAAPASAERFAFSGMDSDTGRAVGVDLDSLRTVNGHWRAWVLSMLTKQSSGPFYAQALTEFDCEQERSHVIAGKFYGMNHDATGDVSATAWEYLAPATAAYGVMQFACGKRVAETADIIAKPAGELFDNFYAFSRAKK